MVGVRSAAWRMGLWACAMWAALGAATARAEVVERTMTAGTEQRSFLLSRPSGATTPLPVVIALHGAGESAEGFMGYLGLEETAARNRFVAVYPQGIGRVWNDGRPAAMRLKAMLTPGDDVTFLVTLTQQLVAEGIADPNRIYMMGISNGGFMVERMACEHADLYAAFSVIMATAPANYREQCRPSRPVPIMFIHGTADPVIAWDGFWTPMGATLSAPDSAQLYAALNGCGESQVQDLPDLNRLDGTTVSVRRWEGCTPPGEVALYRVERGGHQSPARVKTTPELATVFLGLRNGDIDAGMESWALFSRHSLAPPTPVAAPAAVPLPARPPQKPRSSRAQAVQ
ncbi:putative poly(3-hydroxybutyrate) depolymerase precursor [Azorhizobium caulinodans ORS 571]|uniref:Putative poly(3-hydroxybutyrate) depolymerase n=1 Tax=Azorhizobium caulinodans (strain ATCC 43989 / DSM 5975 / JCM 20966 / LMG 6465 / NBRC 14845 / NCIMB 13405 / ORS 571) TaxID=438753 RepID=A8INE4_AZOC5|nr:MULTISPECIES: PHB depolymerase family esterase [Azorhizobium]TDU00954.1 poly(3-hydroxybutyrate) depolymerase [Azorhizobium sp. AG788]BAF89739.1 putative poly(3-hydroxybutyrate) depolymerase precursor [Azorhizobium caulinodans ORS 571]